MAAPRSWFSHERYPRLLFALLAALSTLLAIAPHDRADWALENVLVLLFVFRDELGFGSKDTEINIPDKIEVNVN